MTPSHKCLDRLDLAVAQPGLWLILQSKLTICDGVRELADETQPLRAVVVFCAVISHNPRSLTFREIHRDVRMLEQLVNVGAMFRDSRVADACLDPDK